MAGFLDENLKFYGNMILIHSEEIIGSSVLAILPSFNNNFKNLLLCNRGNLILPKL